MKNFGHAYVPTFKVNFSPQTQKSQHFLCINSKQTHRTYTNFYKNPSINFSFLWKNITKPHTPTTLPLSPCVYFSSSPFLCELSFLVALLTGLRLLPFYGGLAKECFKACLRAFATRFFQTSNARLYLKKNKHVLISKKLSSSLIFRPIQCRAKHRKNWENTHSFRKTYTVLFSISKRI